MLSIQILLLEEAINAKLEAMSLHPKPKIHTTVTTPNSYSSSFLVLTRLHVFCYYPACVVNPLQFNSNPKNTLALFFHWLCASAKLVHKTATWPLPFHSHTEQSTIHTTGASIQLTLHAIYTVNPTIYSASRHNYNSPSKALPSPSHTISLLNNPQNQQIPHQICWRAQCFGRPDASKCQLWNPSATWVYLQDVKEKNCRGDTNLCRVFIRTLR